MPTALLHAYIEMLPRIQAQRLLDASTSTSLGFGAGEEGKDTIKMLQRVSRGEHIPETQQQKVSGSQFAAMMRMPIRVKKKKE